MLSSNLSAGELPGTKNPTIRETFLTYIAHTFPQPRLKHFNDPLNTPHNRLMAELLKESPDITTITGLIEDNSIEEIDNGMLFSPLMASAILGHNDVLKMLIDKGVEVNQVNRRQQSAAMLAALANNSEALKLLKAAGAKEHLQDNQTSTALDYAKSRQSIDCIKMLS